MNKLPRNSDLDRIGPLTKGELAERLYGDRFTIDCAVPQTWLNDVAELTGEYRPGYFVSGYSDECSAILPLTVEAKALMAQYVMLWNDREFVTE